MTFMKKTGLTAQYSAAIVGPIASVHPSVGRPIRRQPDGRDCPRLSNTGDYGYMEGILT